MDLYDMFDEYGAEAIDLEADAYTYMIDNMMRIVQIPEGAVVLGVEGDRDVNAVRFTAVKDYKGVDLSTFKVRVNYVNANGDPGYYDVKDAQASGDDVVFTWLVEEPVTRYKGDVKFAVRFYESDTGGVVSRAFNTTIATASSLEGLDVMFEIPEEVYKDLLEQMRGDIDAAKQEARSAAAQANTNAVLAKEQADKAEASSVKADKATTTALAAAGNANDAATRAENATDAITENFLKRSIGPDEVLTADDTYPQTPLGLKVYGNTRQNLWANPVIKGAYQGLTATEQDDGSLSISGTATADTYIVMNRVYALKPSTTYTVSVDKSIAAWGFYVETIGGSGKTAYYFGGNYNYTGLERTFTTPPDLEYVVFAIAIESGATLSGTYRVMLNEGETAEPWCPPGLNSVESLEIVTAGKNLLDDNEMAQSPTSASFYYRNGIMLPPGTYTLSCSGAVNAIYAIDFEKGGNIAGPWYGGRFGTFTLDAPRKLALKFYSDTQTPISDLNFQLELGSTATDYEPPNVNTVPIDLKGNELCGLPDGTRDALECVTGEAVKDTQKVVFDGTEDWKLYTNANLRRFGLQKIGLKRDSIYLCDKFPVINPSTDPQVALDLYFFTQEDYYVIVDKNSVFNSVDDFKSFLSSGNMTIIGKAYEKQTFQAAPPEFPALPAPNLTAYADADVPAEIELEYARDANIAYGKLEDRIAALEKLHQS